MAAPQIIMKITIGVRYLLPVFILITHKHRDYDLAKVLLVTIKKLVTYFGREKISKIVDEKYNYTV